jgi:hypothetical protein
VEAEIDAVKTYSTEDTDYMVRASLPITRKVKEKVWTTVRDPFDVDGGTKRVESYEWKRKRIGMCRVYFHTNNDNALRLKKGEKSALVGRISELSVSRGGKYVRITMLDLKPSE